MKKILLLILIAGFFGSCAPVIVSRVPVPMPRKGPKKERLPLHALHIPKGHLPPPGSCRIWYIGRPPGHQPPPFKCGISVVHIPLGALLIQRIDEKIVHIAEYDQYRPNYVVRSETIHL